MITKAQAIDAVSFELKVTGNDGTVYRIDDPINGDSGVSSAYVFDYQYAGSAQPGDMTRASQQFTGWTPFSTAERVRFTEMLARVESIANVDFQLVSGQADPTMHVGKVTLAGNTAGTGGFNYSVRISGGEATLADYDNFVVYDSTLPVESGRDNLLLHEIMHALGLKHPFEGTPTLPAAFENNKYTVLSYTANPDNGQRSDGLQLLDIAALQNRWGANLDTATGNDVYTGSRNTTVDVVWDAGGSDTFDASDRTGDVALSLAQATFSSFDDTDDVAIAYDAVIENAIGGSGNDSVTGNAVANILIGGSGDDALSGAGGGDFLIGGASSGAVETAGAQVYRIYQATLDRAPDMTGFAGWTTRLETGQRTVQEVVTGFVASTEFRNVYGALDDRGFVTLLYDNVLERAPDQAGLDGWLQRISDGAARETVVTGFSESNEFKARTSIEASAHADALDDRQQAGFMDDVFRLYQATLDREPDDAGLESWSMRLADGQPYLAIASGFTMSTEFTDAYGNLGNRGFVEQLYRNVLDREADSGGLNGWLRFIDDGGTREGVVRGFAQGSEFIGNTTDAFDAYMTARGGDRLDGGAGDDTLHAGTGADIFVFDAREDGTDTVLQFDTWDTLRFEGFGYADAADALAQMRTAGSDVRFDDQGVGIVFSGTDLATVQQADFLFG